LTADMPAVNRETYDAIPPRLSLSLTKKKNVFYQDLTVPAPLTLSLSLSLSLCVCLCYQSSQAGTEWAENSCAPVSVKNTCLSRRWVCVCACL